MKRIVHITFLLLLFTLPAHGQIFDNQVKNGSLYSNFGVGLPADFSSSDASGLGLPGVSFSDRYVPGLANPAQWGHSVVSLASGGLTIQNFSASDNFSTKEHSLLTIDRFQVVLPMKPNKFSVSLAMTPLTRSNFQLTNTESQVFGSGSRLDTLSVTTESQGNGGVNSLELGVGWRINNYISVGYAGSLVFASLDNGFFANFEDESFDDLRFDLKTNGTGFGNRFGTFITVPQLLGDRDQLNIGATVTLPVTITGERKQETDRRTGQTTQQTLVDDDGPGLGDGTIRMPMGLAGGLTYKPMPKLSVVTEGLYQQWSDFEFEFNPSRENVMTDRYKLGMGLRYYPFVTGSDKFLSSFKYRLGVSYDTGHLKVNGEQIETLLFSAGLGILSPRGRSNSSIDISLQYGIRGTKNSGLVEENFWGVRLSLNLAEIMFDRRKLQ